MTGLLRVAVPTGLCLDWFLVVTADALLGAHGRSGTVLAVLIFVVGAAAGFAALTWLTLVYDLENRRMLAFNWAWLLAVVLAVICALTVDMAYQSHAGRRTPTTVTEVRCSGTRQGRCVDWDARVSHDASTMDLGWLGTCNVQHNPGDRVDLLVDPRGRFAPQLADCTPAGRDAAIIIEAAVGYVVALTLAYTTFIAAFARSADGQWGI